MTRSAHKQGKRPQAPNKRPLLERAFALQRSGQTAGAEALYRQALAADPEHEEALLGLSLLLMESGRAQRALELLAPGCDAEPASAALLTNLGEAYRRLGLRSQAAAAFRRALAVQPDLPQACFNLGITLQESAEAVEALRWLERAASLLPDAAAMQLRLADALWAADQRPRALGHYQAAVNAQPGTPALLLQLARALQGCELFEGAMAMSARALELDPRCAEAHLLIGSCLLAQERLGDAAARLRRAVEVDANHAAAHVAYAVATFRTGLVEDTLDSCRRAIEIAPDRAAHSNLVFAASFHPAFDQAAILAEARAWARLHADPLASHSKPHVHDPDPGRRLRVGYVSPDFWDHCQAMFMLPVLSAHDRAQVEIVCYASVQRPDALTERLRAQANSWVDVAGLDDVTLAERIRQDRIDVLVDLTMHMAGNRLPVFACRPAPVQISWLAYPGTTGLSQIDYRITDRHLDPPAQDEFATPGEPYIAERAGFSESSLVLPDTFWCYDPLTREHEVSPLPALARGFITFGCLGNLAKVHAGVVALWARVLMAVHGSRLLLRAPAGEPRTRLLAQLARAGIDAARVDFVDRQLRPAYLATYRNIDLCLDTFPYNGHTTSLDAQWMGVPVISLVGATVVGRAGLCHAANLGLLELVADSLDEFVRIAADWASDLDRLGALRAELRARLERSALMDARRFAGNLERAFRLAWRTWCARGLPVNETAAAAGAVAAELPRSEPNRSHSA